MEPEKESRLYWAPVPLSYLDLSPLLACACVCFDVCVSAAPRQLSA